MLKLGCITLYAVDVPAQYFLILSFVVTGMAMRAKHEDKGHLPAPSAKYTSKILDLMTVYQSVKKPRGSQAPYSG